MKSIKVLFILLLCPAFLFAQVDNIKNGSGSNNGSNSNSNNNYNNGTNSYSTPDCGNSCDACVSDYSCATIGVAGAALVAGGVYYFSLRDEIPEMFSLDIMTHAGFYKYQDFQSAYIAPRIRGTIGILTLDARFASKMEPDGSGWDTYNTCDWSVILNPVVTKPFFLRIGYGMMHEVYAGGNSYPELYVGADFFARPFFHFSTEYRLAHDFTSSEIPRQEFNNRLNFTIVKTKTLDVHAMGGLVWQRYYSHYNRPSNTENIPGTYNYDPSLPDYQFDPIMWNNWFVQAGLTFQIHDN